MKKKKKKKSDKPRVPVPPPGTTHKDKSRYSRRKKYKDKTDE